MFQNAAQAMSPEFESIFARLRMILQKHSAALEVTANTPDHFCVTGGLHPTRRKPLPAAWVQIGKAYVSYHFMPVCHPKLRDSLSEKLRARMQGKSCFNFKVVDEALFQELDDLTARGFAAFRDLGFGPAQKSQPSKKS
jgi:hypothetical protein